MASYYQVQPGECILSIAHAHQLPWEKVWGHANNSALKKKRKDPNVLCEGDKVYIPDPDQRTVSVAAGAKHNFVVKRRSAKLRLRVVVDMGPKPAPASPPLPPFTNRRSITEEDPPLDNTPRTDDARKNLAFRLIVDGLATEGTTDGNGYIDCEIPPSAKRGQLIVAPGTPHETEVALKLGHLDPIGEVSGVKQRLRNLCLDCGDQTPDENADLETALRRFQSKHGLSVTGKVDDATRAEILKQHGS